MAQFSRVKIFTQKKGFITVCIMNTEPTSKNIFTYRKVSLCLHLKDNAKRWQIYRK